MFTEPWGRGLIQTSHLGWSPQHPLSLSTLASSVSAFPTDSCREPLLCAGLRAAHCAGISIQKELHRVFWCAKFRPLLLTSGLWGYTLIIWCSLCALRVPMDDGLVHRRCGTKVSDFTFLPVFLSTFWYFSWFHECHVVAGPLSLC